MRELAEWLSDDVSEMERAIVRVAPTLLSVKGNTSMAGNSDSDGIAVSSRQLSLWRVLGYIKPGGTQQATAQQRG